MKQIIKNILEEKPEQPVKLRDFFNLLRFSGDSILIPVTNGKSPKNQNRISGFAAQEGYKVKTEKLYLMNIDSMIIETVVKVTLK